MNAKEQFLAANAHVDEAAIQPLPNSRKVYIEGSRPAPILTRPPRSTSAPACRRCVRSGSPNAAIPRNCRT